MGHHDAKKQPFPGKPLEKPDQIKSEALFVGNTIKGSRGVLPWDLVRDDSNLPAPVGNIPNSNKKRTDKFFTSAEAVLKCLLVPGMGKESEDSLYRV